MSALQHWLFCPRQCALIHVEGVWTENQFTGGRVLHELTDAGRYESRDGIPARVVQITSLCHGLHGVADVRRDVPDADEILIGFTGTT